MFTGGNEHMQIGSILATETQLFSIMRAQAKEGGIE
jgi:hypothetical protein